LRYGLFSTFMMGSREDVQMTYEEIITGLRTLHIALQWLDDAGM
jgi:hypothetical protein